MATGTQRSTKAAQRQFLIKVNGVDALFSTKTGGRKSSDVSKVYDGGSLTPDVLAGPAQVEDITVGRPYDPYRDGPLIQRLARLVGSWRTSLVITPTDADLVPVGRGRTFFGLLTGLSEPEGDAGSNDPATLELTFSISSDT